MGTPERFGPARRPETRDDIYGFLSWCNASNEGTQKRCFQLHCKKKRGGSLGKDVVVFLFRMMIIAGGLAQRPQRLSLCLQASEKSSCVVCRSLRN